MQRREFIGLVGGAAAFWPSAARTQHAGKRPTIGFLHAGFAEPRTHLVRSFQKGLSEVGYIEGQNVEIEYRWADDQVDRLPALAADLVRREVSVIVTPASNASRGSALSVAKASTTTTPIVFGSGDDPVKNGVIASINRPGGNVTGVYYLSNALAEKRLGLLRDLAPSAESVAVLVKADDPSTLSAAQEVKAAANTLGQKIEFVQVGNGDEIDAAFATLAHMGANALLLINDNLFFSRRRPNRHAGKPRRDLRNLYLARVCGSGRSDELRN